MININLHQQILKECNGIDEDNYSNNATKWSEPCQQAMDKAEMAAFIVSSTNVAKARRFDVLRDPCDEKWEDLVLGKEVFMLFLCVLLWNVFAFLLFIIYILIIFSAATGYEG